VSVPTTIAVSASESTGPCVESAGARIRAAGYEPRTFEADRRGGPALEEFVRAGHAAGMLDLTTAELAAELILFTVRGSNRLTAASMTGVPQVISLGGLDAVAFGPLETVPQEYRSRRLHYAGTAVTMMRTTPEENDRLGQEIAMKACAARGPTAILVPLRGVSPLDIDGGPHWSPEADAALFQSLRNWVYGVELIELDLHVNDPAFGRACAETLLRLLRVTNVSQSTHDA
jgi:uncharacterized protein (UPF0261 family)